MGLNDLYWQQRTLLVQRYIRFLDVAIAIGRLIQGYTYTTLLTGQVDIVRNVDMQDILRMRFHMEPVLQTGHVQFHVSRGPRLYYANTGGELLEWHEFADDGPAKAQLVPPAVNAENVRYRCFVDHREIFVAVHAQVCIHAAMEVLDLLPRLAPISHEINIRHACNGLVSGT